MKNANEALVNYILSMTEEQATKLLERLDMVKRLAGLTTNEFAFVNQFCNRVWGEVTE